MSGVLQTFNNLSYSKEKLDDGKIQLSIEVENSRFETAKDKVYNRLAPTVEVQGFRPGKAPKNAIVAKLGANLFEQTINELIPEATLEIIKREKLMPLDRISYKLEKVAEGSGVKYSATFTVFPEFKLPDLKKIKVEKNEAKVKDEEVGNVIKQMFEDSKQKQTKENKSETKGKQKETKGNEKTGKQKANKQKMDDAWAASLNFNVKTLKELEEKIKGELKRQKESMEQNRFVSEVMKQIAEKSKLEVPSTMIDQEVARREAEYKQRIENLGMKVEDFLRNQKTSMEELRKGWKKEALEAIKAEIILIKIANEHDIKVEKDEMQKQIDAIKDEKLKAQYSSPQAQRYLQTVMLRQKVVKKIMELMK
jgi:FKBP-type peptidyl-prolyl cis-trans isomerase (trigger factor)